MEGIVGRTIADIQVVERVNGNPLKNIDLIGDPAKNFALIMKDGKIYKNEL